MRISAYIAIVLLGLAVASCSSSVDGGAASVTETSSTPAWSPATVPTLAPKPIVSVQDFKVELKVISKKCFGSAGCNITVEPVITYLGSLASETACDLTYSVSGDESGETIETAKHLQGNTYRVQQTLLSTKSTKVVPAATLTSVDCR